MQELEVTKNSSLVNDVLSQDLTNFHGKYGCQIIFEDNNGKNEIRYKLNIKYKGAINELTHRFIIDRDDIVYINDSPPDTFMDKLAYETSKTIYPLELKVNYNGDLLEVQNQEHVIKRWDLEKQKLKEYYKGNLANTYLILFEKTISNPQKLLHKIKKDWFINLYFSNIYVNYTSDGFIKTKRRFPIAGKAAPVLYKLNQSIENIEDKSTGEYLIKVKGSIKDERCALDIEQHFDYPFFKLKDSDQEDLEGDCKITYMVTREKGLLEGFEAFFDTKFQNPKKVTVKMYLLEQIVKNSVDAEESEEGFWSKFFKKFKV